MKAFQVVVGNIGTVYDGSDYDEACAIYDEYVHQSKAAYGRASGETVMLLCGDDVRAEHTGY